MPADFSRRRTPPDRPIVFTGKDADAIISSAAEPCDPDCHDCLRRGIVGWHGAPAPLRTGFYFQSARDPFRAWTGLVVMLWDGSLPGYVSPAREAECPTGSGPAEFRWRLRSTSDTLEAGTVRLELVRLAGGSCPELPLSGGGLSLYAWHSLEHYDPLCGMAFRPGWGLGGGSAAPLAAYDGTQTCLLCVQPLRGLIPLDPSCWVYVGCPVPSASPPEFVAPQFWELPLPELTPGDAGVGCCDWAELALSNPGEPYIAGKAIMRYVPPSTVSPTCMTWSAIGQQACGTPGPLGDYGNRTYRVWVQIRETGDCGSPDPALRRYYLVLQVNHWTLFATETAPPDQAFRYQTAELTAAEMDELLRGDDISLSLTDVIGDPLCLDPPASLTIYPA